EGGRGARQEFIRMGNPRWHGYGDKPDYVYLENFTAMPYVGAEQEDESNNSSSIASTYNAAAANITGLFSDKPFPDVALTV
ncbi:unnamed protein product, partial [Amoebophrya sp. A120]